MIDMILLDSLYKKRLTGLRDFAENREISKNGSVEVLRARLIKNEILGLCDLSWDGIQAISHKEIGEILKIFGIKSSGSHKERRQRLWLHLNFDSRRMTIERLVELDRETLYDLCQKLEMPLTGTRAVLMGRVAGVLTNHLNGWGKIKRNLNRNGLKLDNDNLLLNEILVSQAGNEKNYEDFIIPVPIATLEDAKDLLKIGIDKEDEKIKNDIKFIISRIEDLDRLIGTILKQYMGKWSQKERDLLIRLATRTEWPIEEKIVKKRFIAVSNDIAEAKGASMIEISIAGSKPSISTEKTIERIRSKINNS